MKDLKALFESISERDVYKRVDSTHPLDLYVGIDDMARWTMLLICPSRPKHLSSSKMIYGKIGQRKDGQWSVSLSLIDDTYRDMFVLFCSDIIDSSSSIQNKDNGTRFIIRRYEEWKKMLANSKGGLLSPEEIKGLLGEMFILDTELMDQYGSEEAALSWTGPKFAHQDFILGDTWYEVKTVSTGKDTVNVSSIEQLDCANTGHMIVVFADKTSMTNERLLNLNMIYYRLLSKLLNDDAKENFSNMLLKYGYYPRPEYEDVDYTFEVKDVQHYLVREGFPCLRRNGLPASVVKAEYNLSLPAIQSYRED